ncbi:Protein REDOX 2 [Linum grandiflorum]
MEAEKAMTKKVPEVELISGRKMPAIGMGTAVTPIPPSESLVSSFLDAIRVGYRHFDTASLYGTEESLGKAVAEAVEKGLVNSRDELFITSKLWVTHAHPDLVLPSLQTTLQRLGMEYVDLYVVHWPVSVRKGAEALGFGKEEIVELDMKGTWQAMEECHQKGMAKTIGVSNFGPAKLTQLLHHATIAPAVNQVEMSVGWQQKELMQLCKAKGVQVCAWSPLGANGAAWGTMSIMDSPILKQIADARAKSIAQVMHQVLQLELTLNLYI